MNVILILCDTLRRDHCGPYNGGLPLNQCWSSEAPDWVVPTPNMDRLAARGTVFEQCYCGSTPCMPARRDIYTGRYEFLERGWGPLEEEYLDLPRQVSGPPNQSVARVVAQGYRVSTLISDHFHLWEQGSGNYHMGYTGFDFVRGCEADAWFTAPFEGFACPEGDRLNKNERHWRNVYHVRHQESDYFGAQVLQRAVAWLERNHSEYQDFYLHLDIFDPHEPWDAPPRFQKMYHKNIPYERYLFGYGVNPKDVRKSDIPIIRALYAAEVTFTDLWIGHLLDRIRELGLMDNTVVVFSTDHGTHIGEEGCVQKTAGLLNSCVCKLPLIVRHPNQKYAGKKINALVSGIDYMPTFLSMLGIKGPKMDGSNFWDLVTGKAKKIHDEVYIGYGPFAAVRTLRWHYFQHIEGDDPGKGPCLYDLRKDPLEKRNVAAKHPDVVKQMRALIERRFDVSLP